jgi:hypothetical protein
MEKVIPFEQSLVEAMFVAHSLSTQDLMVWLGIP